MGFTIRTSIKTGPFRFNLSRSGVGMSVGVRGLRLGTGPRGHYVHMSRGVLQYRVTLPSTPTPARDRAVRPGTGTPHALPEPHSVDRIESASVLAMTDESAAGLLQQISAAQERTSMAPMVVVGGFIAVVLMLAGGAPAWAALGVSVLIAALAAWVHARDLAARNVVLFYDLEPDARAAYEALHAAFARLARADAAWNMEARMDTDDRKRNAGATQLVERRPVQLGLFAPSVIRTNIDVPAIPCGHETLHFFPDRLLVSSPQGMGAIPYDQLRIDVESHPFIEEGRVPADAIQVGTTWKYVNRNGSPDRRFADNRQLPVLRYEQITFTSPTGLREVLQLSAAGCGSQFRSEVERLGALARGKADVPPTRARDTAVPQPIADSAPALPLDAAAALPVMPGVHQEREVERFARGVVEYLVVRVGLRQVLEIFADAGLDGTAVHPVEALLFAALPFDALLEVGHLGDRAGDVKAALRHALAERATGPGGDPVPTRLATARLDEYAGVAFEPGQVLIRDGGMEALAERAYARIVGGATDNYALRVALFTYFTSASESLRYGEVLAELYDEFTSHGDRIWGDEG